MVPMVEIVEQLVEFTPLFEPFLFRDELMIGPVEVCAEAPEHPPDGEVVLVVAVEAGGVEDDGLALHLRHVAAPEVAVQQRGGHNHLYSTVQYCTVQYRAGDTITCRKSADTRGFSCDHSLWHSSSVFCRRICPSS